jgi:hypothetical protein
MKTPFFDVPVYRLPQDEYNRQLGAFVERSLHPQLRDNSFMRQHLFDSYGGCWRFNEIIGYIRLYFLGSQVRGEYFAVRRKRQVRTRHKRLEWQTHKLAPEVTIEQPITNMSVAGAVRQYLEDCKRELPRRHVDLSVFEVVASHVCWRDLWAEANPFGPKRKQL